MPTTSSRARAVLIAMLVLLTGFATTIAKAATMFPSVESQNLNGRSMKLPRDFNAPASIVFVAYVREQQKQIDSWKAFVTGIRARFPSIGVFEVPTLSKGNAFFRAFIDGGMRRGIPDWATREATITLYIDKTPFDEALGITSERDITVLLVEPNGAIVWRSTGAFAPEHAAGLTEAISTLGN